jgi:protein-tyrosine phosphatase
MKLNILFLATIVFSQIASAGVFLEPLKGTDKIYRGRAPRASEMKELVQKGITSVLIFKNQIKSEVSDETQQLTDAGLDPKKIYNIPFQWKDIASEKEACEQVIDALSILQKVEESAQDRILFHCTVGEDRTGLLAGLMSQLMGTESTESSFDNQMCAKGYAGGNPNKPRNVSAAVDKFLTPLYYKISKMIKSGQISAKSLNRKVCKDVEILEIQSRFRTCNSTR